MKPASNKKKDSSPTGNSNAKKGSSIPKDSNSNSSTFYESNETAKQFHDRFDYLLTESIGSNVIVTTTAGIQYTGILSACNLDCTEGIDVVLKFPKIVSSMDSNTKVGEKLGETFLIHGDNVAELELEDVNLSLDEKFETTKMQEIKTGEKKEEKSTISSPVPEKNVKSSTGFKTDVDISGARNAKERELQRWTPDEEAVEMGSGQTLEEASSTWDQFSVNEKKFGIKPTYDEHFYTTKINRNGPNYHQKLKEAQRIADEIEGQGSSGNIHLAEDRGIIIDDSGMDEEDLYSGVDRRGDELLAFLKSNSKLKGNTKSSKYVPPTLRNQPHHMDPAIICSSATQIVEQPLTSTTVEPKVEPTNKTLAKDSKESKEQRHRAHLKNIDEEAKQQLKEIKRQSGRSDHERVKSRSQPSSKTSKEAQIEELKSFAQKFKVPYDVPKDMGDVLRKPSTPLKADPSLPPKPKSSASTTTTNKSASKINQGSSSQVKADPKKSGSNAQSPFNSPPALSTRSNMHSRRRQSSSFFGSKTPQNNGSKKGTFGKNFNFFLKSKEAHEEEKSMEPFLIEKPYFAAPTWNGTIEESHKTLFADQQTIIQEAQAKLQKRQMNSIGGMNGGPMSQNMGVNMNTSGIGMMGFPMTGGPNGSISPNPMMNGYNAGSMGMYMPFQPQPLFYPSMGPMGPMMNGKEGGSSPSPQGTSPHVPPGYMHMNAPYGYPVGGMPPFPNMMGGNNMMGDNKGYHGGNNHNNYAHYNNSHHKNNNKNNNPQV